MKTKTQKDQNLLEKILSLPPNQIEEVEDFIDFLLLKSFEQNLTKSASKVSENCFAQIWNNPEDDIYDQL